MPSNQGGQIELPEYKCHKEVWALKIADLMSLTDGSAMITPTEERYAPFKVSAEWVSKHEPQKGGYYVVYENGYTSFSPSEAFESGYTKID